MGQHLGLSLPTVQRTWAFARAWLFNELKQELGAPSGRDVKTPRKSHIWMKAARCGHCSYERRARTADGPLR